MSIPIVLLAIGWLVFALLSLLPVVLPDNPGIDPLDRQQAAWMARLRLAARAGAAICAMLALIAFFEIQFPAARAPLAEPPSWWQTLGAGLLVGWLLLTIFLWRAIPLGALFLLLAMLFAFSDPFTGLLVPVPPIERCRQACAAQFGSTAKLAASRRSCIDQCFRRSGGSSAPQASPAR